MAIFGYGLACYFIFFGTFVYLAGFVEGLVVPRDINDGAKSPLEIAIATNLGLIGLFAVQHTIMSRPGFKRWFTSIVPVAAERSTFVLVTSLIFILMFWQWRAMPEVVWEVADSSARTALLAISLGGWVLALYSSFLIDHFDLFGLRQVWLHFRGKAYTHPEFRQPMLYRMVRNPLMLGFLIAFWAAPTMTQGRLLFAAAMTGYILIGIRFEERDLLKLLGEGYEQYRARTPMLIPMPWKRGAGAALDKSAVAQ
jgi:protein-S-isoprenylcysteine O-methyltransferase Ste14